MNTPTLHQKKISHKVAIIIGIAILIAIIWIIIAHHETSAAEQKPSQPDAPMFTHQGDEITVPANSPLQSHLAVATASEVAQPSTMSFPGQVEADPALTVNILPPLTGRLVALNVKLGDIVKKGQVLAVISSPDLAQAVSDVTKARDALNLADKALVRARGVNSAGANATKDLEAAQSNYNQAEAENARATERLNTLGADRARKSKKALDARTSPNLTLTAPTSGVITALNVGVGSYINDATATMMTLSNIDQVVVGANIPEDQLSNIKQGQTVNVKLTAFPDQVFHGNINSVGAVLDPNTRRSEARISFDNVGEKLKPNMYATVEIAVPQPQEITLPQSALLMNNDSTTVFVEVRPNVYVRRVVELGSEDETSVKILSGIKAGDRIIVSGGVLLND